MSEAYLKANLNCHRKEVLDELTNRERKKEIREQRNHFFQWVIVILSFSVFVFTAITFFSPFFIKKNKTANNISTGNPDHPHANKTNNKTNTDNKKLNIK